MQHRKDLLDPCSQPDASCKVIVTYSETHLLPVSANGSCKICSSCRCPAPCRQEPAAAGTKRPRSQDDAEPCGDVTSTADAPIALAIADSALSESADTAAVAAAIAATDRADAILHNVRASF